MRMQRIERVVVVLFTGVFGALAYGCGSGVDNELFGAGGSTSSAGGASGTGVTSGSGGAPTDAGPPDDATPPDDSGPPVPPPDETDKVFEPSALHTISIDVEARYLQQLDQDTDNRVPCNVTFDDQVLENAGCRKKGGLGSVAPLSEKTGFSIKFDEFDEGKSLYGMKRLLLNNAIQDPGFLNEHIGYEVYRKAGIPAARTAHGMVRFNGRTKGLFVIAEPIDKFFLKRNFGEDNKEGNLYEGPAGIDFVTDLGSMELKDEVDDMRTRDDLAALASMVQSVPNTEFPTTIRTALDLDVFIRGYAIDSICDHWDGYSMRIVNNYYMFDAPETGRFVFLPHGMDQLLQDLDYDVDSWPHGRLAQRVREIPELDAQFHAQIVDVLTTAWDVDYLLARIDLVTAAVNSNTNTDQAAMRDVASYNANVERTRQAMAYRKALLLDNGPSVCGDGTRGIHERCDDGNTVSGDGCSSACFVEDCTAGELGSERYLFCPSLVTAADAATECDAYGATLAVPRSEPENTWLKTSAFAVARQNFWIGIDDQSVEGTFVDTEGTPVTFFDWGANQPNGATEQNCVSLQPDLNGWNDKACQELYGAVCQLP